MRKKKKIKKTPKKRTIKKPIGKHKHKIVCDFITGFSYCEHCKVWHSKIIYGRSPYKLRDKWEKGNEQGNRDTMQEKDKGCRDDKNS